jgi:hypothetical protein
VLGGTSILGGRGKYIGTIAGVILITLLQSILSVMQIAEFGKQIIYGAVIIAMLLLYGRDACRASDQAQSVNSVCPAGRRPRHSRGPPACPCASPGWFPVAGSAATR